MYKVQNNNKVIKKFGSNKGITLIALVVTIIVLIILAGITIGTLTGNDGIIQRSKFSSFGTKIRQYEQRVDDYVIKEGETSPDGNVNEYVTDPEQIKEILGDIEDGDENKYVIQDNELRYNPDTVTDDEEEWLIELGILAMTATFLMTFMANGSVFTTIQSDKIAFPSEEPMNDTQGFAGWFYDQEYKNQAVEGDELTENITLYAKMNELEKYTITYIDSYADSSNQLFDTKESGRALPSDKVPSDKYEWSCGSEKVKYVFSHWDYSTGKPVGEQNEFIEYNEGDIINYDIQAIARYKTDYGDIQNVYHAGYSYYQGGGYYDSTTVPNPAPEKVTILNGEYEGEKIVSVEIEDAHCAFEKYTFGYYAQVIKWRVTGSNFCDFLTINNEGDLVLTRQPQINEGVIHGGAVGYSSPGYYLHYVVQITTESGKKEKVLIEVTYDVTGDWYCLAEGTKITLADMSRKNIEDIEYLDELLVWDFDNGCFAKAKPLWIKKTQVAEEYNLVKFDDGTELKTVADHRIFNMEKQEFTYTMDEENTPIGTSVFKEDGSVAKIVERKVVKEKVNYYNIITNYHMNLFANGLLTSLRLNNLYKIENMKFVKDDRELTPREEFEGIPDKYIKGLRLAEQPKEINRGNDVKHTKTLQEYVKRLLPLEK